ncbi:MAG: hypothetical protein ACOX2M_07965 [Fastidiosipilaceae bacterium]|jgi:ABC-2 type transport system permease protein
MLKALVKSRFASMFSSMFRSRRVKQKRGPLIKALIGLFTVYIVFMLLLSVGSMFGVVLPPLRAAGLDWLYFALAAVLTFGITFISGIFMTQSELYEATDNELLLAMPVPPRLILISRLLTLLVMEYFFEALIALPVAVVYWTSAPATPTGILFFILAFLFLPLMTLALASFMGWLLALLSTHVRRKSLIITLVSLAMMFAYMMIIMRMNRYIEYLIYHGAQVGEAVRRVFLPAYLLGVAIAEGHLLSLLGFIAFSVVSFGVCYLVLSVNFLRIVTLRPGTRKVGYKERPLKPGGQRRALILKEIKYFLSKPIYILNASLGAIVSLILPLAALFNRDLPRRLFLRGMGILPRESGPILIALLCLMAGTNLVSAPSISLEGKRLWILQSSPIRGGDVLLAKAGAHLLICLPPTLFASLVFSLTMGYDSAMVILLWLVPAAMTAFQALFGVAVNLRFPKFDWINETVPIKQSLSTFLAMFGGMTIVIGAGVLYLFALAQIIDVRLYIALCGAALLAISAGLLIYLKTKGEKEFAALRP